MTDNDVTDDDLREARLWAEKVDPPHTNPGYSGTPFDIYNAARVILDTVPAPPATLADELRYRATLLYNGDPDGDSAAAISALADRAEELEARARQGEWHANRYDEVIRQRDGARASLRRESEALSQWMEFYRKAEEEVRGLNAEVERLTSIIKNHPDSEYVFAPGGVIGKQAKVNLDRMNLPAPADVPEGEAWRVKALGRKCVGVRNNLDPNYPWTVISDDLSAEQYRDAGVTLVARLVPDVRRVIDRPEDLDKLPFHSVVIDGHGVAKQKGEDTKWDGWFESDIILERGPATLVYEPEVNK